jgi:hypothetical protein
MMKRLLALLGLLMVAVGLNAQSYTKVQCKVGNDTITLPVPSKYVIVGRDVSWAKDYFRKAETTMKDPGRCNTIILGMVSKEDYDLYQSGTKFYGFSCEVTYRNEGARRYLTKSEFVSILDSIEKDINEIISDPEYKSAISSDTEFSRSMANVVSTFSGKSVVTVSKSDRHHTFALRVPQAELVAFTSIVLVEGKALYFAILKSDSDAMGGVDEANKWIAEIRKTTPAESSALSKRVLRKTIEGVLIALGLSFIFGVFWLIKKVIKLVFQKNK